MMVLCSRMWARTQRYCHGEGGLLQWVLIWCLQAVIARLMETKPQVNTRPEEVAGLDNVFAGLGNAFTGSTDTTNS